jgi:hypothetical protein
VSSFPFTVAIGPASSARPIQEVTDFDSWTLDNNLDDGCSLEFSCRGDSDAGRLISELETDIWLYRGPTIIQRFRVTGVSQDWNENGGNNLFITSSCYRRLLKKSFVRSPLSFTNVSQGDIVSGLVAHAQAASGGSLGITDGSLGPAILRDRNYEVGQNVFDAIVDLAKIENGIAWDVNADLELIVTTQLGFPTRTQPVELGVTARRMERPSSSEQFANASIVTGNVEATVPAFASTVDVGTDPRGRWERFVSLGQESDQAALQERADGLILESLSPVSTWTVDMEPTRYFFDAEYEIGDLVTVVRPRDAASVVGSSAPRISAQTISRQVTLTADGDLQVIVTFVELP